MGCAKTKFKKAETIDYSNVEIYVELLKNGKYDTMGFPPFTFKDIPELLRYRNNNRIIANFPINPVSSFAGYDCKLGVYILWTIESIRTAANNKERMFLKFPSQNPILAKRDPDKLIRVYDDASHEIAAKAYFDWWNNNITNKSFGDFKHIDPLEKTDYRWN